MLPKGKKAKQSKKSSAKSGQEGKKERKKETTKASECVIDEPTKQDTEIKFWLSVFLTAAAAAVAADEVVNW